MKTIWAWTQTAFAGIGGVLGWYLGGLDGFLYALIAFVMVDSKPVKSTIQAGELTIGWSVRKWQRKL